MMKNLPENFDWEFYLEYYEDLKNAGLKTKEDAEIHYLNHGQYENRMYFDYLKINIVKDKSFLKKTGVNLFGFGNSDTGLGHIMRVILDGIEKLKIPYNLTIIDPKNTEQKKYFNNINDGDYDINIIVINPDFKTNHLYDIMPNKYNIGVWSWELDKLPEEWKKESEIYSEIWTISSFCEEVFKKELPTKIIKKFNLFGNFKPKRDKEKSKKSLGFEDKFVLLFVYDTNSDINRKNPMCVIKSFEDSLSKIENTLLVIKTHNMDQKTIDKYFTNKYDNILLINETWSNEKMVELFNSTDIYVSLHRSEGLGLTMMEAIDLEIPVVCTNYSGNLDFCFEGCELVDYDLVNVETDFETYNLPKKSKWAEPKIDDAKNKLLKIYNNYNFYLNEILKSKEKLNNNYNLNVIVEFLKSL